ncbi:MAG TPA: surface carbohydrate biosynthesis protein [Thermohalobaculum sp.]|nr:surface carbohydrate biosynthesis protein [Thermohalobaculum sp.]
MPADRPHLILPCETRVREFEAKLLLACFAAERGWRVTVGSMRTIDGRAARLARGVYVGKGVTRRKVFLKRQLRRLGHTVTAWDEEGLVWATPELYRRTKVDARALNLAEHLFAWGEENAAAWRGHPGFAGTPISVTGNPRTDLLRPELRGCFAEEAARLSARHGAFILVNTNFSRLNHFIPGESLQRRLIEDGGGRLTDDDPRLGLARHKQALFDHFLEMVPALARRFPERKLILRPHPSESPDVWREALAGAPNAEVVHEGNVAAWLMAAAALVHNGCTTAVESFLLDRPAVAYRPVVADAFDHPLPNGLSVEARDLAALMARVADALALDDAGREAVLAPRRPLARRHIASAEGPPACERILDALDALVAGPRPAPGLFDRTAARAALTRRELVKRARRTLRRAGMSGAYRRHMFPAIEEAEVARAIGRFGALLGRFGDLRLAAEGGDVFTLSRQ